MWFIFATQLKVRFVKRIVALTILNAFIEVNFRKCKLLFCGTNHLPAQNDVIILIKLFTFTAAIKSFACRYKRADIREHYTESLFMSMN